MRIASFLLAILFLSCNHPFDPRGPVEERLVVYSVLITDRDNQFVRVYTNYDVSGFDPLENKSERAVIGAQVSVSGPRGTYSFKDTLLPRADTSRYKTPIAAYVARWRPEPGQAYTLIVNAQGIGSTSATVTTPIHSTPITWYYGYEALDDPASFEKISYISFTTRFSATTKLYTYQAVIEYLVLTSGGWRTESIELPQWASDSTFSFVGYPSLYTAYVYAGGSYTRTTYIAALQHISGQYRNTKLTFKRIVFRFLQTDQNWYDYYSTVRNFQDPFSIRLDEPDFTNLSSGYGLFGACCIDTLEHLYPGNFPFNHQ